VNSRQAFKEALARRPLSQRPSTAIIAPNARILLARKVMLRMGGKAGIMHAVYPWMLRKPMRDALR